MTKRIVKKQFASTATEITVAETVTAALPEQPRLTRAYPAYVGIDQHAAWLVVAVAADESWSDPEDWGRFENSAEGVKRLLKRLGKRFGGEVVALCYEAGPCGFGLHRLLTEAGHDCLVVSPASVALPSGRRRKTDRRDAKLLAKRLRSGELKGITVPDEEREAMRSLTRCRSDAKNAQRIARQQLQSFLLRLGVRYTLTRHRWTKTHYAWLADLKLEQELDQLTLQNYVDAEERATAHLKQIEAQLMNHLKRWSQAGWVTQLRAFRGIDYVGAMVLVAELGDLQRFAHPRHLMAYLGLIPGEHSSGETTNRLSIGRGNRHARRILIEAAWCYRLTARKTKHIRAAMADATASSQAVSWKAQQRLCGRYRSLTERGKSPKKAVVAIARELCGFLWAAYQQPEHVA